MPNTKKTRRPRAWIGAWWTRREKTPPGSQTRPTRVRPIFTSEHYPETSDLSDLSDLSDKSESDETDATLYKPRALRRRAGHAGLQKRAGKPRGCQPPLGTILPSGGTRGAAGHRLCQRQPENWELRGGRPSGATRAHRPHSHASPAPGRRTDVPANQPSRRAQSGARLARALRTARATGPR